MFTSLKLRQAAMPRLVLVLTLLTLVASASGMFVFREDATAADRRSSAPNISAAGASYAKLPLSFEPNQGQADGAVKFLARGNGYRLSLLPDGAMLALQGGNSTSEREPANVMRLKLVGANPSPRIEALNELPGKSNYFIGNDPKRWRMGVANYASVKYRNVYPGADVIYYGNQGQLEYDFILQPGANPRTIKLAFSGVEQMRLEADGDLTLRTGGGEVRQRRPVIYQETNGAKQFVAGRYVQTGEQEVGFEIGDYDASRPLVIDPVLSYSSYFGGNGIDLGSHIAVDASGNIYLAGATTSVNFTTASALQPNYAGGGGDCFITKLNPSGTALIYSTYLGGAGADVGFGLALDSANNVYLIGLTGSANFPLMGAFQPGYGGGSSDAFITKLNANGSSLAYSTYLGGSSIDAALGLAIDATGAAYIVGETPSPNFPTKNALQPAIGGASDTFVVKVQPDGAALVFSTYLGGSGTDIGVGIAVDDMGSVYVSGSTASSNFPLANALQPNPGGALDVFVTKLNASGSALVYSTYLGGSGGDGQGYPGNPLAVDAAGNVYLTGATASANFPLANPLQATNGGSGDAFVTKLNASGAALVYSTYLGGSGIENIQASDGSLFGDIAVDGAGQVYVTGLTTSANFPTGSAVQASSGGNIDVFVTKLNASGAAVVYSTYFGGNNDDRGLCIALDPVGGAYVTGWTKSPNYQTVGALQAAYGGGVEDAFILKLAADAVTVSAASFSGAAIAPKGIVAAFGPNLATSTVIASSVPLPTALAGTTVRIRDSAGVERDAPLFFVSAGQVNYQIPDGTAAGPAAVTVTSGDGRISSAVIQVRAAAPAIFTANASGSGAAAAVDAFTGAAAPFNATRAGGEPNIISVFGTGLGADATDIDANVNATATIDGNPTTILYAGRAPGFVGLNQFNVVFPAGITTGTHTLVISRNGVASNTVTIAVR